MHVDGEKDDVDEAKDGSIESKNGVQIDPGDKDTISCKHDNNYVDNLTDTNFGKSVNFEDLKKSHPNHNNICTSRLKWSWGWL